MLPHLVFDTSLKHSRVIYARFTMKTVVVFLAFVAVAAGAKFRRQVSDLRPSAYIVNEVPSNNIGLGDYKFSYELSDGQSRQESAQLVPIGNDVSVLRVTGSYSWVDPADGQVYTVNYIADENGFQPQGAHLPVAVSTNVARN